MDAPKPTAQHKKLERMTGTWTGEEQLPPSSWDPKGGAATSRSTARLALGGLWAIVEYQQKRTGKADYTGLGVYGYDTERQRYSLYWFDSMSTQIEPLYGTWEDDDLVFEGKSGDGLMRMAHRFAKDNTYTIKIEGSQDGTSFLPLMEGKYRKG